MQVYDEEIKNLCCTRRPSRDILLSPKNGNSMYPYPCMMYHTSSLLLSVVGPSEWCGDTRSETEVLVMPCCGAVVAPPTLVSK